MKRLVFILFFAGLFVSLNAQNAEEDVVRLKNSGSEVITEDVPEVSETSRLKGHMGMSVGSSFTYMPGYGSIMGFSMMPTYTLPLNQRWSLHTGLIATQYRGLNVQYEGYQGIPALSNLSVFAAASYKATDRLILHGAGVKSLVQTDVPPLMGYPGDRMSFGATYKFGNNFSIGATIQMNRGSYGYGYSPFYSPFGW